MEGVNNMKLRRTVAVLIGILICAVSSVVMAYPNHLNGNPNYILVDGHMGIGWYLDRSSLVVQKYEPPCYTIAVNVVRTENGKILGVGTMRFFYNYDDTAMYWDKTGNDGWEKLQPLGSGAETRVRMPAGEMAFYLAYNMKFYGAYTWSGHGLKNVRVYDNDFYARAR